MQEKKSLKILLNKKVIADFKSRSIFYICLWDQNTKLYLVKVCAIYGTKCISLILLGRRYLEH